MIRVVLDSNVLASGVVTKLDPVADIMDQWRAGTFQLVVSLHILIELERTLGKTYFRRRIPSHELDALFQLLNSIAERVEVSGPIPSVATHHEDDYILATATQGKADYLVTGDQKLQKLKEYEGVKIVSPREFMALLDDEFEKAA